jgi:DNA (cytosine-5)-methyltransferase 1
MRRIAAGIEKYWGEYARPFLAILRGTGLVDSVDDPLSAITTSGAHHALVQPVPMIIGQQSCSAARPVDMPIPTVAGAGAISMVQAFITRFQGDHAGKTDGDNRNHNMEKPLPAVDTSNRYGIVEPFITAIGQASARDRSSSIDEPISTVVTKAEHCLIEPLLMEYYGNGGVRPVSDPVPTVTTKDRFAVINGAVNKLDILFRMLKPHEAKQAQGFSKDYIILGTMAEQMKQIGNAVPPGMARALSLEGMSA